MPDMSANAALFRGPHRYTGYLSVPQETVVMSRAVNMATITYPLMAITFDNAYSGVGAYTDVKEGMEVIVYSGNTSTIKGRLRVAAGGATATVLQVNEFSESRIDIDDNDKFEVVRSYRVRDKLVGATKDFKKDSRVTYTNQTALVKPLPRSGGHYAGFLSGGSLVVPFFGSLGENRDPDSGSGKTYAWTTSGGTLSSSSAADPTLTLNAAGTYWVQQVLTDTSNSQTETQRSVVRVHDANDLPIPVTIQSLGGTGTDAWTCTFRAYVGAGIETLPDGAMVIYHEDEQFGSTAGSYGNRIASRSRVKFIGYLIRNTIRIDSKTGELTFEAMSPLGVLRQLPGFSQVLTAVASPDTWQEWKTPLKTNDVLVYLLRWHSTFLELFDLILPGYNYDYPEFFIQKQTPAAQTAEIADAVDAMPKCDRTGALIVRQDLSLVGSAARTAATTTYALTDADIIDIELEWLHRIRVGHMIGRGFTTTGSPLQAESGRAPGEAEGTEQVDRLIVLAQGGGDQGLNQRTGRRFAKVNRIYYGKPVPKVTVTLRGSYDFFDPAYDEWVTLTINRTVAGRLVSFSAAKFQIESVDVRHESTTTPAGTTIWYKRVTLTLIGETNGVNGITIRTKVKARPSGTTPVIVVPTIPLAPLPLLPQWAGEGGNISPFKGFALSSTAAKAAIITALTTSGFMSTEINTGLTGNGCWATSDPFDYRVKYVLTETGLYKADVWNFTTWTLVATNLQMFGSSTFIGHLIKMNITKRGYIVVASGSKFAISFNYGATWTQVDPSGAGAFSTTGFGVQSGHVETSPYGGGWVWFNVYNGSGNNRIYFSSDWGLTSALQKSRTVIPSVALRLAVPYRRSGGAPNVNDGAQETWAWFGGGNQGALLRYAGSYAGTETVINSINAAGIEAQNNTQSGLTHFTWDSDYWYGAGRGTGAGANRWSIFRSVDGTTVTEPVNGSAGNQDAVNVNGWPLDPNVLFMWSSTSTLMAVSFDGGLTSIGAAPAGWTGVRYFEGDLSDFVPPQ